MAMTDELRTAYASENRLYALRRAADHELQTGTTREQLIAQLDELRTDLHEFGGQGDEDIVLDVMDFVSGWCSSSARL
jgi:hypothetical protein